MGDLREVLSICPDGPKNQRACLSCGLVKTLEQFHENGCHNCETFLSMKDNAEKIQECTSGDFFGIVAIIDPTDSWVAKWQNEEKFKPGCYALRINGRLMPEYASKLPPAFRRYYQRIQKQQQDA